MADNGRSRSRSRERDSEDRAPARGGGGGDEAGKLFVGNLSFDVREKIKLRVPTR